jgi:hypothetical protein
MSAFATQEMMMRLNRAMNHAMNLGTTVGDQPDCHYYAGGGVQEEKQQNFRESLVGLTNYMK